MRLVNFQKISHAKEKLPTPDLNDLTNLGKMLANGESVGPGMNTKVVSVSSLS